MMREVPFSTKDMPLSTAFVQYALLIYPNKPLNTKPSNLYFNASRLSVCDGRLGARIPNCNVKVLYSVIVLLKDEKNKIDI